MERIVLLACAILLVGCQPEQSIQSMETGSVASSGQADPCQGGDLQSNLEYSDCWLARASKARSQVEVAYGQAKEAAQESDEQERNGTLYLLRQRSVNDQEIGEALNNDAQTGLVDGLSGSQSEWEKYYDQQCELERRVARGGTGSRALLAKCQERLSHRRIDELDALRALVEYE